MYYFKSLSTGELLLLTFFMYLLSITYTAEAIESSNNNSSVLVIDSPTDSINNIENNPNILLQKYIEESEAAWDTDKNKAEVTILKGFDIISINNVEDSLKAQAYHLLGKILVARKDNNQGIDTLLKSIELKERVYGPNHPKLSKTYNYIGIAYFQLNDFDNAKNYYEKSVKIHEENNIYSRNLYDAYLNIGIVYAVKGKFKIAYEYFNKNFNILDSLEGSLDSLQIARFYLNLGNLAALNGKLNEANKYLNIAESIFSKTHGPYYSSLAGININKGVNAYYNYDYSQATLYYKRALEIDIRNDNVKVGTAGTYANLSKVAFDTKNYKHSIQYAHEGLKFKASNNTMLILYKSLAKSYALTGEEQLADDYYNYALNLSKTENVSPKRKAALFKDYADFLIEQQEFTKGKNYYRKALVQSKSYYGYEEAAYASLLSDLGNYFLHHENNFDSASAYYDHSIKIWDDLMEDDLLEINEESNTKQVSEIVFFDAYHGKAQLLHAQYIKNNNLDQLNESYKTYKVLLDRVDQISKNLDKENSYVLLEKVKPAIDQAIEVTYELYFQTNDDIHLAQAFDLSERSKSSALLNSIQKNNNLRTAEVPEEIVMYDQELQEEIHGLRHLLADEQEKTRKSPQKISFFNTRMLELMIKQDSLIDEIEKNFPKYYALKYDRSVINLESLTNLLDQNEVVLEYTLTDSALFIFAISKDQKEFERINIDSSFFVALQHLIELKNTDVSASSSFETGSFIKNSACLWNYLIKPVYPLLSDKHLIVVPDGLLGYVSFDVLVNSEKLEDNLNYRSLPYLLREFPLSYSYSSSLKYNAYFKKEVKAEQNLLAFSPSYSTESSNSIAQNRSNLKAIPNAAEEVLNAQSIFGGDVFMDVDATRNNFLKNASKYKIIHLAMHALINDSLPMLSELVFTQNESENLIHTYEIFGLNLNAEMVILSACNTGTGKLQKGEGIMSLARGFVYAGVPSIVMTLWEIQDQSGLEIMNSYYGYLKENDNKDIALQKAKIDYLDNANMIKSHPYFWSSYIVSGDTSSINSTAKYNIYLIVGLGILLLLIVIILIKKSAKTG